MEEATHGAVEATALSDRVVDIKDTRPCISCCCFSVSAYCREPQCLGFAIGVTAAYIDHTVYLCKCRNPALNENREDVHGVCWSAKGQCIKTTTCLQVRVQALCVDVRVGFPWDNDAPCVVALCGWVCCFAPPPYGDVKWFYWCGPTLACWFSGGLKCPCTCCCAPFFAIASKYFHDDDDVMAVPAADVVLPWGGSATTTQPGLSRRGSLGAPAVATAMASVAGATELTQRATTTRDAPVRSSRLFDVEIDSYATARDENRVLSVVSEAAPQPPPLSASASAGVVQPARPGGANVADLLADGGFNVL